MKYFKIPLNQSFIFEYEGHVTPPWGGVQFVGFVNNNHKEVVGLQPLQVLNHELMTCKYSKGTRVEITRVTKGIPGKEPAKFTFKRLDSQMRF